MWWPAAPTCPESSSRLDTVAEGEDILLGLSAAWLRSVRLLFKNEVVAEAIALVSIVSGAAVAVLVPFVSARLERTRLTQQSRDARMDELRGLLDEALRHLYLAGTVLYEINEERPRELPRPDWSAERLKKLGQRLTEQADVVMQDGLRISLRTPPSAAIYGEYRVAVDAILWYELEYRHFVESERRDQEKPPEAPWHEVSAAIGKFMTEVRTFAGVVDAPVMLR
jgi:hypothetical protein